MIKLINLVGNLTREYVFLNNSKYLMYRINFRENHGSSINTVISNLAMYEPDVLITIDSYSEYSLIKYGYNDPFTLNHFNQNKNIIFENVSLGLGKKNLNILSIFQNEDLNILN